MTSNTISVTGHWRILSYTHMCLPALYTFIRSPTGCVICSRDNIIICLPKHVLHSNDHLLQAESFLAPCQPSCRAHTKQVILHLFLYHKWFEHLYNPPLPSLRLSLFLLNTRILGPSRQQKCHVRHLFQFNNIPLSQNLNIIQ